MQGLGQGRDCRNGTKGHACARHLRNQVNKAQCLLSREVRTAEGEEESRKLWEMVVQTQKWEMQKEEQQHGMQDVW